MPVFVIAPPGRSHDKTFNGTIIETGSESYRLAHTKARQQLAATS